MMIPAVAAAIASASGFALSTSAQHHAAEAVPAGTTGSLGLLRRLVTSPLWVFGALVGALSFVLHGVALHTGAIALVQPIVVSGVILAIPVKAMFNRRRPSRTELSAVTMTAVGLATFLVVAHPSPAGSAHMGTALGLAAATFAGAGLTTWGASGIATPTRRAMLFGCAGGLLFGLVAGLLKVTTTDLSGHGLLGALTGWPLWLMVAAGVGGVYLNQRAYQIAPLSTSMPALNAVNVIVALGFGLAVFDETPAHGVVTSCVELAALAAMIGGLRRLARATEKASTAHPPADRRTSPQRIGG